MMRRTDSRTLFDGADLSLVKSGVLKLTLNQLLVTKNLPDDVNEQLVSVGSELQELISLVGEDFILFIYLCCSSRPDEVSGGLSGPPL